MMSGVQLQKIKEELKKELRKELKRAFQEKNSLKVLGREELQKVFNCNKTKMNEIMRSIDRPPVVYIGRDYYITEKQLKEYFENKIKSKKMNSKKKESNFEKGFKVLHKQELMSIFKMGRTKFLQFINTRTLPVKIIGQEYYITEECLEEWFGRVQGTEIRLN